MVKTGREKRDFVIEYRSKAKHLKKSKTLRKKAKSSQSSRAAKALHAKLWKDAEKTRLLPGGRKRPKGSALAVGADTPINRQAANVIRRGKP